MLNQIVLVGRLTSDPEVQELEEGKKKITITIACPRSYKNAEGIYETDFIDCVLWNAIATNVSEYCKKGDIVGIKGRIQTTVIEDKKYTEVVAEKVTFLSSGKKDNKEE